MADGAPSRLPGLAADTPASGAGLLLLYHRGSTRWPGCGTGMNQMETEKVC